ncbi:MAG: hypothetical protein IPK23_12275 [Rhizobiales bacterium]|nr:hypothetical protein [Hyphomicrobiales bacterium]
MPVQTRNRVAVRFAFVFHRLAVNFDGEFDRSAVEAAVLDFRFLAANGRRAGEALKLLFDVERDGLVPIGQRPLAGSLGRDNER